LEALVAQFARRDAPAKRREADGSRCFVVSVRLAGDPGDAQNQHDEIVGLVRAQGDHVVASEMQVLTRLDPRTFVGGGMARELAERALDMGADMLVFDAELSPSQTRNLEDCAGLPVCDREAVILNVFQRHARTRSAKIQVEVAQLEYLRPRIRGLGLNMDQQAGGVMGSRGPGETASELLARRLDRRLAELRQTLAKLKRAGEQQRGARKNCARIALVGYTNAGKTSLMNALTGAGLSARDSPFETLETTSRSLARHGGDVVLSDTVGFIRRLPERLFASFESTLGEIRDASLIVMVVDLSDNEWREHIHVTERVLDKLGIGDVERVFVFNKLDRVRAVPDASSLGAASGGAPWRLVSQHAAHTVEALRELLLSRVSAHRRIARVFVAYEDVASMNRIYRNCVVLNTEEKRHGLRFTVEAEPPVIDQLNLLLRG
jgi:GTP-binding protein HflX